jgi:cytochrome P450
MEQEAASRELPGPTGWALLRTLALFLHGDLLSPFERLFDSFGPVFRLQLPLGHDLVMLAHPDAVEHVLRSKQENYVKGSVYDGARLLLGNGLVTSEGSYWQSQRALANPAFRPSKLEQYLVAMTDCTRQLVSSWERGAGPGKIDAQEAMTRLTMAIVGRTLFGLDLDQQSDRARESFDTALSAIGRRGPANLQVPLWLPTPGNLRFRKALRDLDTIVYDIIGDFRSGQAEGADQTLLGAYLTARNPDSGEGMSDQQLRDEVITLYLAGHETTASLLTWALYWLGRRPDIAEQVTAEIDAEIPSDSPSMEELKKLPHTSRFINEILRLYPPAWTIARNAVEEDMVLGYRIPAGAIVMLSPYLAHRWGQVWPDPSRFDPDRFAPDVARDRHPFAYFPFSLGSRICIGMQFSLMEARLVLALILRRFRVQGLSGPEVRCVAAGTLRPDRPIRIELVRRRGG